MNRTEAIDQLRKLQASTDTEAAHSAADDIICVMLRQCGFDDVVDEYQKVEKWFA